MKTVLASLNTQKTKIENELSKLDQKYWATDMPGVKLTNKRSHLNNALRSINDTIESITSSLEY